jgi:phosphoenolpyruvate carboxykinase (GTP)
MAVWELHEAYLEVLKSRIEPKHYERLMKIENPTLHAFVAKYIDLCEPDRVYVSAGTEEDIEYIRRAALRDGEEIRVAHSNTCRERSEPWFWDQSG